MRLALLRLAAALSLAAAALHAAVTAEHFREWWGYGVFFVLASSAQALYGLVLLALPRRSPWEPADWLAWTRRLFWAGILLNLGTIALYVVTRTTGIPFGPAAGETEPIGLVDIVSKTVEATLVACLAVLARRSPWAHNGPSAPASPPPNR